MLKSVYNPVAFVVDVKSESTIEDMSAIGIRVPPVPDEPKRGDLLVPVTSDVATAFGMLVDAANNGTMDHEDQAPLNSAVTAPPRPCGTGGLTFDHKRGIEVGPGVVAMLAMWGHRERLEKIKDDYDPLDNIW
jgi:hypothetical protein